MFLGKHQKSLINYLLTKEDYVGWCGADVSDVLKRLQKRGLIEIIQKRKMMGVFNKLYLGGYEYEIRLLLPVIIYYNEIECNHLNRFNEYLVKRDQPYRQGYYYTKGRNRHPEGYYYDREKIYYNNRFIDYGPFSSIKEAAYHYISNRLP